MSRTIEFDRKEVINKAMDLFWEKGFRNTSLSDLVEATGLHKGSLYGTFKSKENLFVESLEYYSQQVLADRFVYDCEHIQFIENFFTRLINEGESGANSRGCLVFSTCLEFSQSQGKPGEVALHFLQQAESVFKKAIEGAQRNGDIDQNIDPGRLCKRLIGAAFAIRALSKFRRDRVLFQEIANGALAELGIKIS